MRKKKTELPCRYLEWDSNFFSRRIGRITTTRITQRELTHILTWCRSHKIECLYFLAESDDALTTRLAENNGFRFVDVRVTLERSLDTIPGRIHRGKGIVIRACNPDDIPALRRISKVNHRDTRFHYDSHFPTSLSDRLYETWIERSCLGYADHVLIADVRGTPAGYITCHLKDHGKGEIGLMGVSADFEGQGLGQRLVNASLRWFAENGAAYVSVVTQGRNFKAQRLYQKCGFLTGSVHLWYHYWLH